MISQKIAVRSMLGLLSLLILFHLIVLIQLIPYDAVWAGRLNSVEEMYRFESISILINVLLLVVFLIKAKNLRNGSRSGKVISIILWVSVGLFALNTIGNLFAENLIERILGTP